MYCREYGLDVRIHADPLRAGTAVAIDAAIDVIAFDDDVGGVWAAVTPPLGRAEEADYRSPGRDRNVRRARVAADVNFRSFYQFVKALEARLRQNEVAGTAICGDSLCQIKLFRAGCNYRRYTLLFPQFVGQLPELFGVPELCHPSAAGVKHRKIIGRLQKLARKQGRIIKAECFAHAYARVCGLSRFDDGNGLGPMLVGCRYWKFKIILRHRDIQGTRGQREIFSYDVDAGRAS